jgi:hypothetical protein
MPYILKVDHLNRMIDSGYISYFVHVLLILAGLLLPIPATAQTIDADVDFYALPHGDDKPYYVGDRITLRLEVTHPAGAKIDMFPMEEQWGDFEVVEQTEWKSVNHDDGSVTTGRDIIVTLFAPGQYQTPALVVEHQKQDGSIEELGAPVIRLKIDSVLVEGDNELRDIKEQAILPVPPLWPYILAGLVAAFVVLGIVIGGGLWYYHRWRHQAMGAELPLPVIDARPPEVIAYAELDRIHALNLPAAGEFKEHYSLVTDCLRRYIEGRYRMHALDRTTSEIRMAFRTSRALSEVVLGFMNIFTTSDLVKFARFRPDVEDAYQVLGKARYIVKITTPVPKATGEGAEPTKTTSEVEDVGESEVKV